jgi:hypothetical protein
VDLLKTKSSKLTKLEKKWYKEYLGCFNATDALRKAYPDNKYAKDSLYSISYQTKKSVFSKLQIDDDKLFDMMGITETMLIQKGKEGMDATRPIFVNGKPQAVADYQTRHKYWQDFMKMKNMLKDKLEVEGQINGAIQVNIQVSSGFTPRHEQIEGSSSGGNAEQPTEIQSIDLAQEGEENNDSDTRTTETSTP